MNRVLLDTNVFIWMTQEPKLLGPETRRILENQTLYLSSLSVLEIYIKRAIGKLKFSDNVLDLIENHQIQLLDGVINEIEDYQIFDESNKDPFDNSLVTIAKHHKLNFVTADKRILKLRTNNKYSWIIDSRL